MALVLKRLKTPVLLHESTEHLQRCAAHVPFIDMWNEHFDALQRLNRAVPEKGSVLKNNEFAVMHNILSVVDIFSDTLYISSGNFPIKADSVMLLGLECSINPQNLTEIVNVIF